MIIFDDEIIERSCSYLAKTDNELSIIFYSISPLSNRSPLKFRHFWMALHDCITRIPKTKIILSGWNESNPQQRCQIAAKKTLEQYGALVKIGNAHTIIHPKCLCFDNKILLVGSHNATEAGFTRTRNISITTQDLTEIAQFNDYFQKRWDSIK